MSNPYLVGLQGLTSIGTGILTYQSEKSQSARQMEEESDRHKLFERDAKLAEEEGIEKSILKDIEATKRLGDMKSAMASSGIRSNSAMYGLGQQMEMAENERRSILRHAMEVKDRHLMSAKWSKMRYADAQKRSNDAWKTGIFSGFKSFLSGILG